ncbi:MAG: hypothetical protein JJU11_08235 [Candidatus Sumerlaeia bacterium]|nr:hypothetical protein [Candidatus Sumerlaeia bacterium]
MRLPCLSLTFLAVLLIGCGDREPASDSEPRVNVPVEAPVVEEPLESSVEGMSIIRIRPGTGTEVSGEGDEILLDLQIYDDGNRTWSGVFGFTIGKNQASDLLELGASGAVAGEERRIELEPGVRETGGMQRDEDVSRVYQFRVEHVGSLQEFLAIPSAIPGGSRSL